MSHESHNAILIIPIHLVDTSPGGEGNWGICVLTRHGQPAARLVPIAAARDRKSRRAVLEAVRKSARAKAALGASAARSQDFLYGANGLPE